MCGSWPLATAVRVIECDWISLETLFVEYFRCENDFTARPLEYKNRFLIFATRRDRNERQQQMTQQTNLYFVNTQYSRRHSGGRNLYTISNSFFFSIIFGCATCVLSCAKTKKTKKARKTENDIQTRDLIYHWTFIWSRGLVAPEILFSLDVTQEAKNEQKSYLYSGHMTHDIWVMIL